MKYLVLVLFTAFSLTVFGQSKPIKAETSNKHWEWIHSLFDKAVKPPVHLFGHYFDAIGELRTKDKGKKTKN